jgi:AmmeMemoRadiSam system protein B
MNRIRRPAVAGLFYPDDRHELQAMVQALLRNARATGKPPKALIAPHAGYVYSGPVAASAYGLLASVRDAIRKVVLIGPSHRVGFQGIAVTSAEFYATPLGNVPIDREMLKKILELPGVVPLDRAHAQEHSLEVHLPFLQEALSSFELIPLVAGVAAPEEVSLVLERLWDGPETLIVASSDLSHYHDYRTAQAMDRATSEAIENLRSEDLTDESACGRVPVRGLLQLARRNRLAARTVDLRNSGDTAGGKESVVGYGAYAFE